ncbi:MAG: metal ABC transporter ATP-binding protein [Butyribacter sp.]|nr:metal ABC transporter ATP-binding protein [bacterium]MDY3855409.1 metal ABC transporter ATP-binding protein [Butyribacter sp.]
MKQEECLICCRDAGLGYDNKPLIEHFNFVVNKGDYICIVGENGSGKSTLLKTLLGLIKPVSGEVKLEKGIQSGKIGYLPQQTDAQRQFPASVMEVVLSGFLNRIHNRPYYRREEKQQAIAIMDKLGIADLKKKCYGKLSGGQQQRVLLARALCAAQDILVLDEPVTGLDPAASATLYQNLRDLNQEGMAVIMVTHDLRSAIMEAKYILHLNDGEYFYGTTEEYKNSKFADIFAKRSVAE